MSEIQTQKHTLKAKIDDLETKLASLKAELQKEIEAEQHEAIDQLDFCFTDLDNSFASLKEFMEVLRDEFKKTFK